MCTHCPVPCSKCRAGGNAAYCEATPCSCECHSRDHAKADHAGLRNAAAVAKAEADSKGWARKFDADDKLAAVKAMCEACRFGRDDREPCLCVKIDIKVIAQDLQTQLIACEIDKAEIKKERDVARLRYSQTIGDLKVIQLERLREKAQMEKLEAQRDEALRRFKEAMNPLFSPGWDANKARRYLAWAQRAAHPGLAWPSDEESSSILEQKPYVMTPEEKRQRAEDDGPHVVCDFEDGDR